MSTLTPGHVLTVLEGRKVGFAPPPAGGTPGPKGDKGDQGDPGNPGDQGPQGIQGPQGAPGQGFVAGYQTLTVPDNDATVVWDGSHSALFFAGPLTAPRTFTIDLAGAEGRSMSAWNDSAHQITLQDAFSNQWVDIPANDRRAWVVSPYGEILYPIGARGPAGDPGTPGTNGADGTNGPLFRGAWSGAGIAYALQDLVEFNGSSYICIAGNTSNAGNNPNNAAFWSLFVAAGSDGVDGVSAYAVTSLSYVQPGIPGQSPSGSVTIRLDHVDHLTPGLPIVIANGGMYTVASITPATKEISATSSGTGVVAGTTVTSGQAVIVGAAGPAGSAGATGPAPAGTGLVYVNAGVPEAVTVGSGLSVTGAAGSRTIASTGGSSGWTVEYSVDFTALPTSAAAGNGSFTVDGNIWTVENFANADFVRVLNGTGLQIDPNATSTDYFTTTRTAPLLSVPITTLIPDYDPTSDWLRLWVEDTLTNCDQNFEIAAFGFTRLPYVNGGASQLSYQWSNGFSASRFMLPRMFRGTTNYDGPSGTPLTETARGIVLAPMGYEAWYLSGVVSGAAFPTASTTNHRGMSSARPSPPSSVTGPSFASASEVRFEFAAYPVNTANTFSAALKKLRIERKR